MTNANDPIKSIQSRIDELEETISERSEQIRGRTMQLKEDLQEELSPMELIKKHPVEAAGVSLVTGIVAGRVIRSLVSPKRQPTAKTIPATPPPPQEAQAKQTSPIAVAAGAIGAELLHAAKDLAITWLKSRVEMKKKSN
jgi:hypothetical protein